MRHPVFPNDESPIGVFEPFCLTEDLRISVPVRIPFEQRSSHLMELVA
jgi:hypothetical protein